MKASSTSPARSGHSIPRDKAPSRPSYSACHSPHPAGRDAGAGQPHAVGPQCCPSAQSLPGGLGGYQPFMFWSLYSIFLPSSLGWILRGNSRWVNSFPSSSGLRNACGTKQRLSHRSSRAGSVQQCLPRRLAPPAAPHRAPWDLPACQDLSYGVSWWGQHRLLCCNSNRQQW